jgi:hypothetical protein
MIGRPWPGVNRLCAYLGRESEGELQFAGTALLSLAGKPRDELQERIEKLLTTKLPVPHRTWRKPLDYVASIRRAMEGWSPPSNERWMELMNPLLPSLRIAHMILVRFNRAEVQQIVAKMRRSDTLDTTMYQLAWAGGWFQKMADVCFAAEERMSEHGATKANMDHLMTNSDDVTDHSA